MAVASTHLKESEFLAISHTLRMVAPLSDEDLCALLIHTHRRDMKKGEMLLKAGDRASTVAFVMHGGMREYYVLPDGTERTKNFHLPGEITGSLADLLSSRPSMAWISAEQPSTLLCTPWDVYQQVVHDRSAWRDFAKCFAERLYLQKVEREYELLALDAAQRYQRALSRWPDLEAKFSQKDIASYVGVTAVHLSRVRGVVK